MAVNNSYPGLESRLWKDNFCFVQAADSQLGLIDSWARKQEEETWEEDVRLSKLSVQCANQLEPRPKFMVICGDLINAEPTKRHYQAQMKDFKEIYSALECDIPLVCVCGNHDVGNTPTAENVQSYRSNYGDDYFSFWVEGVFFIVLNSQYYFDRSLVPDEYANQESWLDEQLEVSKSAQHTVVFQHIPPFISTADEPDQYFNLPLSQRTRFLSKLKEAGVRHLFCGHYHGNAVNRDDNLEVVVTSAIGQQLRGDESGMRIVKVFKEKIEHDYHSFDKFPTSVCLSEK